MKTCSRHRRKRVRDEGFDSWDEFIERIKHWNIPVCSYEFVVGDLADGYRLNMIQLIWI